MKILGIDFGARAIGLAISPDGKLALAAGTISSDVEAVARAAEEMGADELVVGLPLNMDGTRGPAARRAERFARQLRKRTGLPVHLADERLTTAEAQHRLAGLRMPRWKKKKHTHVVAAQAILEAYLATRPGRGRKAFPSSSTEPTSPES